MAFMTFENENMNYEINVEVPDYDSNLCCNGGSYYQPLFKVLFEDGTNLVLSDESCGDFGSEIRITITFPDGTEEKCQYGSMLCDWQEFSTISQRGLWYFEQVEELCYSYHPLLAEEE